MGVGVQRAGGLRSRSPGRVAPRDRRLRRPARREIRRRHSGAAKRTSISFVAATLALGLAFGSSSDDSGPEPLGTAPTPDQPAAPVVAAPAADQAAPASAAAELTRLLPEVGTSFEFTRDTAENGVPLPLSLRVGLFGLDPASVDGVALWGVGRVKTAKGDAFLAATMIAAGGGDYTFFYVHPTEGGGLAVAEMGTHSVTVCGDAQTFRGAVDVDGGLTIFVERWTEECPDGDGTAKTESMLKMHPHGELELIAG